MEVRLTGRSGAASDNHFQVLFAHCICKNKGHVSAKHPHLDTKHREFSTRMYWEERVSHFRCVPGLALQHCLFPDLV